MRVLVTGGHGLIGAPILARLHRDGHELIGAGRRIDEAARRFSYARWVAADFAALTTADAWRPLLDGIDAVVNCVGVLQDSFRDDTRAVHVTATCALFQACARAGIRPVVHVSAMGVAREGPTAFARTKAEADEFLARLDLDWVILRPALVLAPAVYGGTAMLRALAALPGAVLLAGPERQVHVVSVDDVAETVARCLKPAAPARVIWELGHPHVHALGDIVKALRRWQGHAPARVFALPKFAEEMVAIAADLVGRLGWRSPARTTAMTQLAAGVVGDPTPWMTATGITPQSLEDILAARPANVQDRWFARLYLLKPFAIGGLALFWLVSGLIDLVAGAPLAIALSAKMGLPAASAAAINAAGALMEIVLGLALCVRRSAGIALIGGIVVVAATELAATVLAPQQWMHQLGPFVTDAPLLLATLFTLAILDER
jgi:uncharacterized protein YbjT (DUF2867 family)